MLNTSIVTMKQTGMMYLLYLFMYKFCNMVWNNIYDSRLTLRALLRGTSKRWLPCMTSDLTELSDVIVRSPILSILLLRMLIRSTFVIPFHEFVSIVPRSELSIVRVLKKSRSRNNKILRFQPTRSW